MNKKTSIFFSRHGFTLLEVIATMMMASILFSMVTVYFSYSIQQSALPVVQLNQSLALSQTAERITAHYRSDMTADLNILKNNLSVNPNQYGQDYTVVTSAFVKFQGGNDVPIADGDPQNLLKIKIREDHTHETITLLFTQQ